MKKFTCKELGGVCEEVFEGETPMDIAKKSEEHMRNVTDEEHLSMKKEGADCEEDKKKWMEWFQKEWDKR